MSIKSPGSLWFDHCATDVTFDAGGSGTLLGCFGGLLAFGTLREVFSDSPIAWEGLLHSSGGDRPRIKKMRQFILPVRRSALEQEPLNVLKLAQVTYGLPVQHIKVALLWAAGVLVTAGLAALFKVLILGAVTA